MKRFAVLLCAACAACGPAEDEMANPTLVLEPRKGAWKDNVLWGSRYNDVMPATEGFSVGLFSADAIPGPPRVQTILLGRDMQAPIGANADFRASIQIGVGALRDEFQVDWGRGIQIPIVANWLRVQAVTYRPFGASAYSSLNGRVVIVAGVAEGALTPSRAPTFTETAEFLDVPGATAKFAPEFAKSVVVHAYPTAGGPAVPPGLIVGMFGSGLLLAQYEYQEIKVTGVLLPAGTDRVNVTNSTGVTVRVTVQWVLGL